MQQRDERVLVVWSYDLDNIIPTCRDFEDKLIKLVWRQRAAIMALSSQPGSPAGSAVNLGYPSPSPDAALAEGDPEKQGDQQQEGSGVVNDKEVAARVQEKRDSSKRKAGGKKEGEGKGKDKDRKCKFGLGYFFVSDKPDVEKRAQGPGERPMKLLAPMYAGVAAGLSVCESSSLVV